MWLVARPPPVGHNFRMEETGATTVANLEPDQTEQYAQKVWVMVVLACATALLASTTVAAAALDGPGNPARAHYVAGAEKICTAKKKKTNRLVIAANEKTAQGDTVAASAKVVEAAGVFGDGVEAVGALKRPQADRAVLARWLKSLRIDVKLFKRLGKVLATGGAEKVTRVGAAVSRHGRRSNAIVAAFGFRSCLISR